MSYVVTAVETAKALWDNKAYIAEGLAYLRSYFQDTKLGPVLILGAGGVGKTTLTNLLASGSESLVIAPDKYKQSLDIEVASVKLKPGTKIEVTAAPGQPERRKDTWPELEAGIAKGKYRGIIQLVCYGYHSLGLDLKSLKEYQPGKPVEEILPGVLARQREEELTVFRQLSPYLIATDSKTWLLTVVTKQDLWWEDRENVERYYRTGEFGKAIADLVGQKPGQNFRSELVHSSLVIGNYVDSRGLLLKTNTAGYGTGLQLQSLRELVDAIKKLKDWEERK